LPQADIARAFSAPLAFRIGAVKKEISEGPKARSIAAWGEAPGKKVAKRIKGCKPAPKVLRQSVETHPEAKFQALTNNWANFYTAKGKQSAVRSNSPFCIAVCAKEQKSLA